MARKKNSMMAITLADGTPAQLISILTVFFVVDQDGERFRVSIKTNKEHKGTRSLSADSYEKAMTFVRAADWNLRKIRPPMEDGVYGSVVRDKLDGMTVVALSKKYKVSTSLIYREFRRHGDSERVGVGSSVSARILDTIRLRKDKI